MGLSAASPTSLAAPTTITFTNTSTNADRYKWDFGNGQTSTEKNPPDIIYNINGVYTVSLTVNAVTLPNVATVENTSTQIITIVLPPPPTADFELLGLRLTSIGAIPDNSISTVNNSTNGNRYTWNFGDGTSPFVASSPSHYYRTPGTFNVTLKVLQTITNIEVTRTKSITIYEIGQQLFGGIIFHSDSSGNCLVAAPNDQGTSTWGCMNIITNITNKSLFSGKMNTSNIVSLCGNSTAAYTCSSMALNGYNDWYLPAKDELNLMFVNRAKIGNFALDYYWTSTEAPNQSTTAYIINFNPQFYTLNEATLKSNSNRVRAIRTN